MYNLKKSCASLILILIYATWYLWSQNNCNLVEEQIERNLPIKKRTRGYKLILLWNYRCLKGKSNQLEIDKKLNYFDKMKCPEPRCKFVQSHQKEKYPLSEYDAILFNGFQVRKGCQMPEKRFPHQLYIFFTVEAPAPWWLPTMNFNLEYNMTSNFKCK